MKPKHLKAFKSYSPKLFAPSVIYKSVGIKELEKCCRCGMIRHYHTKNRICPIQ